MTPGDVMDHILVDERSPRYRHPSLCADGSIHWPEQHPHDGDALLLWGWVMERLRPGDQHHMPLSPAESVRALEMLEVVLDAVRATKARNPVHLAPVEKGGRC